MTGNKVIIPLYHVDKEDNNRRFKNDENIPEATDLDWGGNGLYFWDNIENAKYWKKQKNIKGYECNIAHAQLEITDDLILDLTTPESAQRFEETLSKFVSRKLINEKEFHNHRGAAINAYYNLFVRTGRVPFLVVKIIGHYPNTKSSNLFRRDDDKPYASIENKTIYVVKDQRKLKDRSIEKGVR